MTNIKIKKVPKLIEVTITLKIISVLHVQY